MPPELDFNLFQSQLEAALDEFFEDLSRVKGFNLQAVWKAMTFILTAAPVVVPLWAIATPQQRREAVVKAVNKKIDIPIIPESVEAWAIGYVYNIAFARLGLG